MDLYTTKNQQFAGVPIRQTWGDLAVLNYFLGSGEFKDIVEVGTDQGGLTYFLSIYGVRVWTIDIEDKRHNKVKDFDSTKIIFTQEDIHIVENVKEYGKLSDRGEGVFYFIDGGDKPLEFELFVPLLKKDDLIFLHDYGSEFLYKDIQATVERHKLELQWAKKSGSMLVGFSKP